MSAYNESPEISEAFNELMLRWGKEDWLLDAKQFIDDGGEMLEIRVIDHLYVEDVLPRRIAKCFVCVVRVKDADDGFVGPPLTPFIAKA